MCAHGAWAHGVPAREVPPGRWAQPPGVPAVPRAEQCRRVRQRIPSL